MLCQEVGAGAAVGRAKDGASVGDPLTRLMEGSDPLSAMAALDLADQPDKVRRDVTSW